MKIGRVPVSLARWRAFRLFSVAPLPKFNWFASKLNSIHIYSHTHMHIYIYVCLSRFDFWDFKGILAFRQISSTKLHLYNLSIFVASLFPFSFSSFFSNLEQFSSYLTARYIQTDSYQLRKVGIFSCAWPWSLTSYNYKPLRFLFQWPQIAGNEIASTYWLGIFT